MKVKLAFHLSGAAIIRYNESTDQFLAWYGVCSNKIHVFDSNGTEISCFTVGSIDLEIEPYDPTCFEKVVDSMGRYIFGMNDY